MRISQMVRTAIMTANLTRARAFYSDLLGLSEVFWEGELDDPTVAMVVGAPAGTTCRAVILKVPDKPGFGMVGLFELDPPPPPLPPGGDAARLGEGICVFYCSDLDPVIAGVEAAGGRITGGPVNLVVDNRTKQREMCLRDPDGHLINLIEADPDAARRPEHDSGVPRDRG